MTISIARPRTRRHSCAALDAMLNVLSASQSLKRRAPLNLLLSWVSSERMLTTARIEGHVVLKTGRFLVVVDARELGGLVRTRREGFGQGLPRSPSQWGASQFGGEDSPPRVVVEVREAGRKGLLFLESGFARHSSNASLSPL